MRILEVLGSSSGTLHDNLALAKKTQTSVEKYVIETDSIKISVEKKRGWETTG